MRTVTRIVALLILRYGAAVGDATTSIEIGSEWEIWISISRRCCKKSRDGRVARAVQFLSSSPIQINSAISSSPSSTGGAKLRLGAIRSSARADEKHRGCYSHARTEIRGRCGEPAREGRSRCIFCKETRDRRDRFRTAAPRYRLPFTICIATISRAGQIINIQIVSTLLFRPTLRLTAGFVLRRDRSRTHQRGQDARGVNKLSASGLIAPNIDRPFARARCWQPPFDLAIASLDEHDYDTLC